MKMQLSGQQDTVNTKLKKKLYKQQSGNDTQE